MGKIITYAAGYDAEIVIWIVKDGRDEHKKAVEWLNEHTDEKIGFFLIKLELWQIEGSNPAPKFDILASPNEWAKVIKTGTAGDGLTETKLQQLDFWSKFKNYVKKRDSRIRLQTPRPQHWYDVSMGSSDAHLGLTINSRENLLGVETYINRNKSLFKFLRDRQADIEQEIDQAIDWVDAPVASRIKINKEVKNVFALAEAEDYYDWLYNKTILFQKVFGKYLKEYKKVVTNKE